MRCSHCGSENEEGLFRCTRCGEVLEYYGGPVQEAPVDEAAPEAPHPRSGPPGPRPPRRRVTANVPTNLALAIVSTVLCCMPAGIVAIVFAAQVQGKLDRGDIRGAQKASNAARTWAIVSIVLGVVVGFLFFVVGAMGGGASY